jgi:hypothetical protein
MWRMWKGRCPRSLVDVLRSQRIRRSISGIKANSDLVIDRKCVIDWTHRGQTGWKLFVAYLMDRTVG